MNTSVFKMFIFVILFTIACTMRQLIIAEDAIYFFNYYSNLF
ncbi:hypothetical protein T11_18456 [Trichinella zimbabwensis]|uniref:Lipoprotein n=1 Tax=Trichinella zimbabwensis TaxID=268475 RepID=A0A0V1HW29_9BILA|nr:hypothetical protein T11_18456 [Trichinella zimbabwensis]